MLLCFGQRGNSVGLQEFFISPWRSSIFSREHSVVLRGPCVAVGLSVLSVLGPVFVRKGRLHTLEGSARLKKALRGQCVSLRILFVGLTITCAGLRGSSFRQTEPFFCPGRLSVGQCYDSEFNAGSGREKKDELRTRPDLLYFVVKQGRMCLPNKVATSKAASSHLKTVQPSQPGSRDDCATETTKQP